MTLRKNASSYLNNLAACLSYPPSDSAEGISLSTVQLKQRTERKIIDGITGLRSQMMECEPASRAGSEWSLRKKGVTDRDLQNLHANFPQILCGP